MSGDAPLPRKEPDPEEKILCIAYLEKAGSKKLSKMVRGKAKAVLLIQT
jgi:hypothetical protein